MQYFQRFLKKFMPITIIAGIMCSTSSAMAAFCMGNPVVTCDPNDSTKPCTKMLNPQLSYCKTVQTQGWGQLKNSGGVILGAEIGVYTCDECNDGSALYEYTRVQQELDTAAYGYDCGTVTYYTCTRTSVSSDSGCTCTGSYCYTCNTTSYSCPLGWDLSGVTAQTKKCTKTDGEPASDASGYYKTVYQSCAPNESVSSCTRPCESPYATMACLNGGSAVCLPARN